MQLTLSILMIITLCGMNFTLGFFIGKGNIEIKKKLTEDEKKILLKSEETQRKAIEKYNRAIEEIVNYTDLGGED